MSAEKLSTFEVDCPICLKMYFTPISTSCGHTFCQLCLNEALLRARVCPICRHVIESPNDCHENRILQRILECQFPDIYKQRKEEVRTAGAAADKEARERRYLNALAALKPPGADQHVVPSQPQPDEPLSQPSESNDGVVEEITGRPTHETAESWPNEGASESPDDINEDSSENKGEEHAVKNPAQITGTSLPVVFQRPRFDLPISPDSGIELYFEAPSYLAVVADILREKYAGFILARQPDQSMDEDINSPCSDLDESPRTDDLVGIFLKVSQCVTLNQTISTNTEQDRPPLQSAIGALLNSLGPPPPSRNQMSHWVPSRLYHHRQRFCNNRRELWREMPAVSEVFGDGCCVVRCEGQFRVTFSRKSLAVDPDGGAYQLASATPFFDTPISFDESQPGVSSLQVEALARAVHAKIKDHLKAVGPTAALLFQRKFGSPPILPLRPTSVHLEAVSLWIVKVIQIPPKKKESLVRLNDTYARLKILNNVANEAVSTGLLSLGLGSGNGGETFAFLQFRGPTGSIVLGLVLFCILIMGGIRHMSQAKEFAERDNLIWP